ncbi:MAG: DNA-binding protein [Kiritimatiellae bacterium]|nr:DNA-binding protein [Kiritimatiellia bacterium]
MQISEAKIKRIFVARLEDSEILPGAIEKLARDKKISSAFVILLGGARDGKLVVGPGRRGGKQRILTRSFRKGHEILGIGTIFNGLRGPELHLHAAAGRGGKTLVGCGRTGLRVNLIIEAVIIELVGLNAKRALDPATGFHLLKLSGIAAGARESVGHHRTSTR